jgi:hypothetical protein
MPSRPGKEDLERKLAELSREYLQRAEALAERANFPRMFPHGGLPLYSADQIADMVDELHAAAAKDALKSIKPFLTEGSRTPDEIAAWALQPLQAMSRSIVAAAHPTVRARCDSAAQARINGLLRDVRIGLHGGGKTDEIFSFKPGMWGFSVNLKALGRWFHNLFKGI